MLCHALQAETFQNTTIIILLDVSYHPKDEEVVHKVGLTRTAADSILHILLLYPSMQVALP
jgi:hypothetical protein